MVKLRNLIASAVLIAIIPSVFGASEAAISRSPRSIGGIFKKIFGRRKQTGFQGTSQAQQPYSYGGSSAASSYYPQYAYPGYSQSPYGAYSSPYAAYGSSPYAAAAASSPYGSNYASYPSPYSSYGYGQYGPYSSGSSAAYPSYSGSQGAGQSPYGSAYGNAAAASTPYGSAAAPPSQSGGSLDFHAILDQMVRAAGLNSAAGADQETSSSNHHQSRGDYHQQAAAAAQGNTPVFSFKKLYSFPFYLSSDQTTSDGYNLHVPFLKRHIRRMSNDQTYAQQIYKQLAAYIAAQQQVQQAQQAVASSVVPVGSSIVPSSAVQSAYHHYQPVVNVRDDYASVAQESQSQPQHVASSSQQ